MKNLATFNVTLTGIGLELGNATGGSLDNNGTEVPTPDKITGGETITVRVYFVVPLDFAPTNITVLGKEYALP